MNSYCRSDLEKQQMSTIGQGFIDGSKSTRTPQIIVL